MRRNFTKQAERTMAEIKRDLKAFRKRQELIRNKINDCKSWNDHIEELKDAMARRLEPTVGKADSSSWMDDIATKEKIQRAFSFAIEVRSECRRLLKVNRRIRTETDAILINQKVEFFDSRTN
jgi:hypothetical protein